MASATATGAMAPRGAPNKGLEDLSRSIAMLAKDFKQPGRTSPVAPAGYSPAPQVPEEKAKFFKWFVFILIFLCGIAVVMFQGSKTLQLLFIAIAGCLLIAEPYLQWYLVVKLKFLQRPEFLETMLKVAILVAVLFVRDQNLQIIILIAAAAFFIVIPTVPNLLKKWTGKKTDKTTGKPKQISTVKWVIAFTVAVVNDILLDYLLGIGLVPIIGDIFDVVADGVIWACLGPAYMLPCGIEFVPGVDVVPTYILVVGFAFYNEKKKEKAASGAASGAAAKPARKHEIGKISVGFVALLLVIGILVLLFAPMFKHSGGILTTIYEGGQKGLVSSYAWLKENNPITVIARWIDKRVAIATGGYYEGQVEDNQDTPLGVYLEGLMPADPQFWEDEQVIVWATLRAFTLDKPINVEVSCAADGIDADTVTPGKNFTIYTLEDKFLECRFNKETVLNKVKNGAKNVRFNADYNFKTMSYLKTYFMDLERLRSMRRQNIDPLQEFGITDKYPIAIFTNGPLKIGMESQKELPIGVPSGDLAAMREVAVIGITLENRWKGRVKKITGLEIQLPDSLNINHCDRPFTAGIPADEAGYLKYSLDFSKMDARQKEKMQNITTYQNIKCWIDVNDRSKLLGKDPIATKYIRLTAEYEYQSYEATTVFIKKVEKGGTVTTTGTYAKGCCQKGAECTRDESGCLNWIADQYCSAKDSSQQGKCIPSCTDVCNTESQCTGEKTKLYSYGWCCDLECTAGSLLFGGLSQGYTTDAMSWHNYAGGMKWRVTQTGIEIDPSNNGVGELCTKDNQEFGKPVDLNCPSTAYSKYKSMIDTESNQNSVPREIITAIICLESGGDPGAVRLEPKYNTASYGLMQLLPSTARSSNVGYVGADEGLKDPATNIKYGTRYVRSLVNTYGLDPPKIAAAYNAGGVKLPDAGSVWDNRWKMLSTQGHLDRFCIYFNEALKLI